MMKGDKSAKVFKEIAENLIDAMCQFYEESNAPFELKSVILTLMSRIFRKLRFVY